MPTDCILAQFEFPRLEGRAVVASFDGGRITTDAGALLLGAADRVIGLTRRFAACFKDARHAPFVEHSVQMSRITLFDVVASAAIDGLPGSASRVL